MADKLSWRGLILGWVLLLAFIVAIGGISYFLQSFGASIFYVVLGLLLIASENITSAASSVGGGVLAALVLAFIALFVAHNADDKADVLAKKVDKLQEKLESLEEQLEDRDDNYEED